MSICFVICYFGNFPVWFDAFMLSCQENNSIDWLVFTDATVPESYPQNLHFKHLNLKQFSQLAQTTIQKKVDIQLPYKLCDFKPLYGDIFKNHLKNYDYWGHCDLDLVWGNLNGFFNDINYQQYDIVSSRRNAISGHCTIYKNRENISKLYKKIDNYWKPLLVKSYAGFDEGYFSYYIYKLLKETTQLKIYWRRNLAIERYTLRHQPLGWFWKDGKIYSENGEKHLYIHFMNWKKSMAQLDFSYQDQPNQFYISRTGMFSETEKVKFNFANYPLKTPIYKLKYLIKKLLKIQPKELESYHQNFLVIEENYPS